MFVHLKYIAVSIALFCLCACSTSNSKQDSQPAMMEQNWSPEIIFHGLRISFELPLGERLELKDMIVHKDGLVESLGPAGRIVEFRNRGHWFNGKKVRVQPGSLLRIYQLPIDTNFWELELEHLKINWQCSGEFCPIEVQHTPQKNEDGSSTQSAYWILGFGQVDYEVSLSKENQVNAVRVLHRFARQKKEYHSSASLSLSADGKLLKSMQGK